MVVRRSPRPRKVLPMSVRRDALAVVAVAVYATAKGRSFLPDLTKPSELPAGIDFLAATVHAPSDTVVTAYAVTWIAVGVAALGGLLPRRGAVAWLLPAAGMSLGSSVLYVAGWAVNAQRGTGLYERSWQTGIWYLCTAAIVAAYVLRSLQVAALHEPAEAPTPAVDEEAGL